MEKDNKILICDPPSGWRYGFPKPCPRNLTGQTFHKWLIDNNYPQRLIDAGMAKYCRWWEEDGVVRK